MRVFSVIEVRTYVRRLVYRHKGFSTFGYPKFYKSFASYPPSPQASTKLPNRIPMRPHLQPPPIAVTETVNSACHQCGISN